MRYVYFFLVFTGIFLLIAPIAVPVIKTSADFSMFNTDRGGCSEFAKVLADRGKLVPILYPYNSIDLKEESVLIVVGPNMSFSSLEIEEVSKFLDKGGTLFLADDFGTANELIEGLEVIGETYSFSWANDPGNDSERFRRFLLHDLGIDWVENAEIHKYLGGNVTVFVCDENYAVIWFDDKKKDMTLRIDDGRTYHLKKGARKLNQYITFCNRPLDDIFYCKRADFPVVTRIEDPELSYGVEKLVLNIPSVITGLKGEVFSSKVSVVEGNWKSYPIMAETKYGAGRIILLSDPDIVINDMMTENRDFIENLVTYLGSDSFYFDDAHHRDFNPYSAATIYIQRELDPGKAFSVFAFVAALLVFIETGILRIIARSIGRFLVFRMYYPLLYILSGHIPRLSKVIQNTLARREKDMFGDLPEGVDIKILKRIIKEIRTGSKYDAGHEQRKGKGLYRKTKSRNW